MRENGEVTDEANTIKEKTAGKTSRKKNKLRQNRPQRKAVISPKIQVVKAG